MSYEDYERRDCLFYKECHDMGATYGECPIASKYKYHSCYECSCYLHRKTVESLLQVLLTSYFEMEYGHDR